MDKYINADKFRSRLLTVFKFANGTKLTEDQHNALRLVLDELDSTPAADVEPVKRGKWKYEQLDKFRKYKVTCSECGWCAVGNYDAYVEPEEFIYCPQCGAKMDAE